MVNNRQYLHRVVYSFVGGGLLYIQHSTQADRGVPTANAAVFMIRGRGRPNFTLQTAVLQKCLHGFDNNM